MTTHMVYRPLREVRGYVYTLTGEDGWRGWITWRWNRPDSGGGTTRSRLYPDRRDARDWLAYAKAHASIGIAPYGLDDDPRPTKPPTPPKPTAVVAQPPPWPGWVGELDKLEGNYGWAGPWEPLDGRGDQPHIKTCTNVGRARGGGKMGDGCYGRDELHIGYTRRRVAGEW
jgi:hypothetical protein